MTMLPVMSVMLVTPVMTHEVANAELTWVPANSGDWESKEIELCRLPIHKGAF
jgi:hypothetical protein